MGEGGRKGGREGGRRRREGREEWERKEWGGGRKGEGGMGREEGREVGGEKGGREGGRERREGERDGRERGRNGNQIDIITFHCLSFHFSIQELIEEVKVHGKRT